MSLTAVSWLAAFFCLAIMCMRRPVWGIGLYLLTFYLAPAFWWWGKPLMAFADRFNLTAALILAASVIMHHGTTLQFLPNDRRLFRLLLVYALSATLVHYNLADNVDNSFDGMTMLWKQVGLLLLFVCAIRNRTDVNIFICAILLGSLYIAYEVVVNDRGNIERGRLEGVGTPGARESNYLAGLFAFAMPLCGYWLFTGNRWQKLMSFVSVVLIFEVVLRCNSRGVFLSLIAAAVWLLVSATGAARKRAFLGIALGCLAAYFMIGNEKIINRFMTSFAPAEKRDASAQSRIDYWKAAIEMIKHHPFGSGAEAAFKSDRGLAYLAKLGIKVPRAVHNGYLDIAASWGIQGLFLYLAAICLAWWRVRKTRQTSIAHSEVDAAFFGACLESALITQLVSAYFISSLDGEWFFWWFALAISYERLYMPQLQTSAVYQTNAPVPSSNPPVAAFAIA